VAFFVFLTLFVLFMFLAVQKDNTVLKKSSSQMNHSGIQQEGPSDSAVRDIPSQAEIKRRAAHSPTERTAGRTSAEEAAQQLHRQRQQTPQRGTEEWSHRMAEIDAEHGDDAQNWFHKWNEGLID